MAAEVCQICKAQEDGRSRHSDSVYGVPAVPEIVCDRLCDEHLRKRDGGRCVIKDCEDYKQARYYAVAWFCSEHWRRYWVWRRRN